MNAKNVTASDFILGLLGIMFAIYVIAETLHYSRDLKAKEKASQIERHCDKILEQCIALEKQYIALYLEAVMQNRHDLIERLKKLSLEKYEIMENYDLEKSES